VTRTALVVVDMLNPYDHPDSEQLVASVEQVIDPMADLIRRARERDDVTVIYVNDNYGDFVAGREEFLRRALEGKRPDLVEPIAPTEECRYLSKVRHSAFYSTALGYLLGRIGAETLVVAGQVTEQCILYTALDAYVRHFELRIPSDAVAHIDPELGAAAIEMMRRNMRAEIHTAETCLD
jgi:nicotinamidase-related amidase